MQLQAVWQKLDAALKSPVAVAERPEHGGGVRAQGMGSGDRDEAQGHGVRACASATNINLTHHCAEPEEDVNSRLTSPPQDAHHV